MFLYIDVSFYGKNRAVRVSALDTASLFFQAHTQNTVVQYVDPLQQCYDKQRNILPQESGGLCPGGSCGVLVLYITTSNDNEMQEFGAKNVHKRESSLIPPQCKRGDSRDSTRAPSSPHI